ncbi:hypothetical protein RJZ56_002048 [Blastomyces dermatitidis]
MFGAGPTHFGGVKTIPPKLCPKTQTKIKKRKARLKWFLNAGCRGWKLEKKKGKKERKRKTERKKTKRSAGGRKTCHVGRVPRGGVYFESASIGSAKLQSCS